MLPPFIEIRRDDSRNRPDAPAPNTRVQPPKRRLT